MKRLVLIAAGLVGVVVPISVLADTATPSASLSHAAVRSCLSRVSSEGVTRERKRAGITPPY